MKIALAALLGAALSASTVAAEEWRVLVTPAQLETVVEDEEPVILDIRSPGAYAEGHVQGAVNVPYAAWRGPEENPGALITKEKLTLILSQAGVEPDVPVVVSYQGKGTLDFGSAARVYWTLKSAGVERIAILNGGLESWVASGGELSTEEGANFPSDLDFGFAETWLVDRAGVQAVLDGRSQAVLIDARPAAFFEGRKKHKEARRAGTFSGAVNLVHEAWFDGSVLSADGEAVRAWLEEAGIDLSQPMVSFCNTGHWAATNWFVLSEVAGIEGVKLYPESLVGWTRAEERLAGLAPAD